MSYSFLLKYIIIGDSQVGKSCVLLQYTEQRYRDHHEVTIGVQFGSKMLKFNSNNIKLQIWDTAGQESFKAITRGYYRNAVGAILVYDICSRESFKNNAKWLEEAKSMGSPSLTFILVGNKSDKQAERRVSFEEGLRFAKEQGIAFLETSAKTGSNISEVFTVLAESIMTKIEEGQVEVKDHPGIKVGNQKYLCTRELGNQGSDKKVKIGGNLLNKDGKKKSCCN